MSFRVLLTNKEKFSVESIRVRGIVVIKCVVIGFKRLIRDASEVNMAGEANVKVQRTTNMFTHVVRIFYRDNQKFQSSLKLLNVGYRVDGVK